MASKSNVAPLIAIVGETASGKTALAIKLAKQFNGEIIAADSRTVYKGLTIGTAKPTPQERAGIRHHLLDVVAPNESFTVADFKRLAEAAITDITNRGKLPILVGGTGLYVDAVLYDFTFAAAPDPQLRQELQTLSVPELKKLIQDRGIAMPENKQNSRHLIRAIERNGEMPKRRDLRPNTLIIGLSIEREELRQKISQRIDEMISHGLIDETRRAWQTYGAVPALQAPAYKAFGAYLDGKCTLEEAKVLFARSDLQLAKRQRTWFKRNKSIHWVHKQAEAVDLATTFLNKYYL